MSRDPHSPDYADEPGLHPKATLRDVYFTLLKHRWAAVAVTLGVWLLGFVSLGSETPMYRATALIQIDWGRINLVEDVMVNPTRGMADLYGTQEKILRSRLLAERVVEEQRLWEHPLYRARGAAETDEPAPFVGDGARGAELPSWLSNIARSVQGMVDVRRIQKTQLMEVSFVTPDPQLSADLTNSQVRQYIQFNIDSESGIARDTSSFIHDEIAELRQDIIEKERLLRDYSKEKELVMGETRNDNIVIKRLETLNNQLSQAEGERTAAEARYRALARANPSTIEAVQASASVRELERKRDGLREKYEEMSSTFGPEWPEMQRIQNALSEVERSLEAEIREEAQKQVAAARLAYQEARDREALLRQSLENQKNAARELQLASSDYDQIKIELDNQRQMLTGLMRRRSETDLTADLGEKQPVKVKIIEPATVPEAPFAPGKRRRAILVLLMGIVLGLGTAYLLDHWDDTIHTVEDLKSQVPLPYLGMIPRYGDENVLKQIGRKLGSQPSPPRQIAAPKDSRSRRTSYLPTIYDRTPALAEHRNTLSERFRFLRGSMLLSTPEAVPKVVLVTSPDKACGKTFVSSNLSAALVQLDKKVLLIDSDLRNPRLHRVFHYRNRIGLTNVLTGQKSILDGCIMRTDIENLFLLMAGPKSPNPGELLASPAMDRALQVCADHFDFIILDSAPLLPVFDSHVLSTRCDGVVLVARAGVTSRRAAMQSIELIERVKGKITGIVLNDVDLADLAQYYYHRNYTYEYGRYPAEEERVRVGRS